MTIIGALPFLLQNGTTADATQVDADFDQIVTDVNTNAAHSGTNSDITALTGLTTPLTPLQGGSSVYRAGGSGNSSGTANAQVVATVIPDGFALTFGNRILFAAAFTNTGAMTLNVNGTGATPVFKRIPGTGGEVALTGGEVQAGQLIECIYAGSVFTLNQNVLENGGYGIFTNIAAASTVDLGTAPNHTAQVTGGPASIASFGSSASTTYPFYTVIFSGSNTLVHNASTMVLLGSANITTAALDSAVMFYNGAGAWLMISYSRANGQPLVFNTTPTTQVFLSGSGTYTPTSANVRYIAVRILGGGGGGGGGQNATPGTTGGNSTFGGSLTASGGVGGALGSAGAGGAAAGGYSNSPGSSGGPPTPPGTAYNAWGGQGGSSQLGGGGAPSIGSATGSAGATSTGAGGGGGGATNGTLTGSGGAGGGAGGCVLAIGVATTYAYSVGAGGAGAAGASSSSSSGGAGGSGAAGKIEIIEYY